MSRRKHHGGGHEGGGGGHGGGEERWMASYMDMVTVLMCLFIVLYAMSSIDAKKWEKPQARSRDGIRPDRDQLGRHRRRHRRAGGARGRGGAHGGLRGYSSEPTEINELGTLQSLAGQIEQSLEQAGVTSGIEFEIDERGLVIKMTGASSFFDGNSARLRADAIAVLNALGPTLAGTGRDISVEGHADPRYNPAPYQSTWELAAARATSVLRYLVETCGIDGGKISGTTFGSARPVSSDATQNRRVDIVVLTTAPDALPGAGRGLGVDVRGNVDDGSSTGGTTDHGSDSGGSDHSGKQEGLHTDDHLTGGYPRPNAQALAGPTVPAMTVSVVDQALAGAPTPEPYDFRRPVAVPRDAVRGLDAAAGDVRVAVAGGTRRPLRDRGPRLGGPVAVLDYHSVVDRLADDDILLVCTLGGTTARAAARLSVPATSAGSVACWAVRSLPSRALHPHPHRGGVRARPRRLGDGRPALRIAGIVDLDVVVGPVAGVAPPRAARRGRRADGVDHRRRRRRRPPRGPSPSSSPPPFSSPATRWRRPRAVRPRPGRPAAGPDHRRSGAGVLRMRPASVNPSTVLSLAVGDVIPMPHPLTRPLDLAVEGEFVAHAAIGTQGAALACVVVDLEESA